jgi:hypothetical protein
MSRIDSDEFLGMNYQELKELIETNKIFESWIVDLIKSKVEKPILEDPIPRDYPHYHATMLPNDPQTAFNVGLNFGTMYAAILSELEDSKFEKFSDEEGLLLRHFVFIAVLNQHTNEENI